MPLLQRTMALWSPIAMALPALFLPRSAEPRAFATDMTSIKAIAVSQDGKLIALGDSSGHVEIWELR